MDDAETPLKDDMIKVRAENGTTGYIPRSMDAGIAEDILTRIGASEAANLEVVRELFGQAVYEQIRNDPAEAASLLKSLQTTKSSA